MDAFPPRARLGLTGRLALVTGAGRGIGAAIVDALAQAGAHVALAGRRAEPLQAQCEELQARHPAQRFFVAAMDVGDEASVQAAVQRLHSQAGAVHILVNNAGQAQSQPFVKTDAALWQQMMNVNLTGTYLCIRAVLPAMLQAAGEGTPGRIVQVASTAGLMGYPYVSAYCAAKHGVIGLTRALSLELASKNITVNAVCPGYTETDIVREAIANIMGKTGKSEAEARAALAARNPQQRLVQPQEVAEAVLCLCQDGSSAINGQALAVDGGESAT